MAWINISPWYNCGKYQRKQADIRAAIREVWRTYWEISKYEKLRARLSDGAAVYKAGGAVSTTDGALLAP